MDDPVLAEVLESAAAGLAAIDDYYGDQRPDGRGVASQLMRQLGDPLPKDSRTTRELATYKQLDARWHDWSTVTGVCQNLAIAMLEALSARNSRDADA